MNKVLIVTYYWPPAGGAGVQRTLKFAKYLVEYGWKPYILTVEKPDAPVYDNALLNDVREEIDVFKTKSLEPFGLYKKFTGKKPDEHIPADVLQKRDATFQEKIAKKIRANFFIPDAKIGWYPFAVKEGIKIIEREKINLVFASAPPPTVALIGRKIAKRTGAKFIVDFRDPWLEIVYNQTIKRSKLTVAIDRKLERKVLKDANAVISVSKSDVDKIFKKKVPNQNYFVITNGYDESDFPEIKRQKNDKFTIAYTGNMSPDRVPYVFLRALKSLKEKGITNIICDFAGKFAEEFYDEINKLGIAYLFNIKPFVPHNESVKILLNSDLLLLVVNNVPDNKGIIPGKLYEYFGCRKPILAIGPTDGIANQILKEVDSGVMVAYDDNKAAEEALLII
jgi:glycosyltransferase involved in cell wall biosynthesis